VWRTSTYRSWNLPNERSLPVFIADPLAHYADGALPLRQKSPAPIVSFCGQPIRELLHHRNTAIVILKSSPRVISRFLPRDGYFAGFHPERTTKSESARARLEYMQNLFAGDYNLVVRGGGNFSIRLFEVLASGRIPLFIDTDCVLPLDDVIDWKKHLLYVNFREIGFLERILLDFHHTISNDEFIQRQIDCRKFWERYLTPVGFLSQLYRYILESPDSISSVEPYPDTIPAPRERDAFGIDGTVSVRPSPVPALPTYSGSAARAPRNSEAA
jgi:hypothetical protein